MEKEIITRAKNILSYLNKVNVLLDHHASNIKKTAYDLVEIETDNILKSISLNDINKNNIIHAKKLNDAGYLNAYDIAKADLFKLVDIDGISKDNVYSLRKLINDVKDNAKSQVKLKISLDNQSDTYKKLLSELIKYNKVNEQLDLINKLDNSYIKKLIETNDEQELSKQLNGDYGRACTSIFSALDDIEKDSSNPFDYFKSGSVSLIATLERLVPDVTLNMDDNYGLPKDIVEEVKKQDIKQAGLKCELRNYQKWGVKYILNQKKVLLGDEMGLGKTIQAIASMVSLNNEGENKFLVVCPASVIINWCKEISDKSTLDVIKIYGADKKEQLDRWKKEGGVAVTTYETTSIFKFDDDFKFSMLIVDEAHYIKNYETIRSANVREICKYTERILFMSGTALENNVDEMINLIKILRPDIAKKLIGKEYFAQANSFKEIITPVYYRRKREYVLSELPEKEEKNQWCELLRDEKLAYYKAVLSQKYALARRVSFNIEDMSKSSKMNRLKEIVDVARVENRKIIVFSFFLDTIQKVYNEFKDICVGPINGSLSPKKRQELIDEFTNSQDKIVLAAQIQSGGTGLNIQAASIVVICEPQFKPSIENQAISRAYRMGQTRNVLVYRLLCEKTIDEKITNVLKNKQKVFDAFADDALASEIETEVDDKTFNQIMEEELQRIKYEKV